MTPPSCTTVAAAAPEGGEVRKVVRGNLHTNVERRRLDAALLQPSRFRGYLQVVGNIAVFVGLLAFAGASNSAWLLAALFVAIGFALHRLFFPTHDCIHYTLFPSKAENRVCGVILSALLGTSFDAIRDQHLDHHRDFGKREDPGASDYFVRFRSRKELLVFIFGPLAGSILLTKIGDYLLRPGGTTARPVAKPSSSRRPGSGMILRYGAILCVQAGVCALLTDGYQPNQLWRYPVFNILPAVTIFLFLVRLRMFLEHGSLDYAICDYFEGKRPTARTIYGSWLEQILLCGSNFNFHHEHHLYPAVPGCQLPKLHRDLRASDLDAEDVRQSYVQAFMEIWRTLGAVGRRPAQAQD